MRCFPHTYSSYLRCSKSSKCAAQHKFMMIFRCVSGSSGRSISPELPYMWKYIHKYPRQKSFKIQTKTWREKWMWIYNSSSSSFTAPTRKSKVCQNYILGIWKMLYKQIICDFIVCSLVTWDQSVHHKGVRRSVSIL